MEDIFEDLEILILQNEDDFDRGSGKFILRKFIKEKQAERLTLNSVSQQRKLLLAYEEFTSCKVLGKKTPRISKQMVEDFLANNCGLTELRKISINGIKTINIKNYG